MKSSYTLVLGAAFCSVGEISLGMAAPQGHVNVQVEQAQPMSQVLPQAPVVHAAVPSQQQSGLKLDSFMQHVLPMLLQRQEVAQGHPSIETLSLADSNAVALLGGKKLYAWNAEGDKINLSDMADSFITALASHGRQFVVGTADNAVVELDTARGKSKSLRFTSKSQVVALTASREAVVVSSKDNAVQLQFPDNLFTLQFEYPITLFAHDGKETFVLGNPNRKAVTIFRQNASEIRKIPALPKVLAFDKRGRLYVGAATGQLFILNELGEQGTWSFFSTGEYPIKSIAVYDEVILIAHEGSGLLKAFDLNGQPRYSILLSPRPVKQIAMNESGSIACVTQSGKIRRWMIDPALREAFVPLAVEEKTLLYTMMFFAQKYGFSEEQFLGRYPQYQGCMEDIPQVFRDKLKKEYPIIHSSQGIPAFASGRLMSGRGKLNRYFVRMQRFAQEHAELTTGAIITIVYLALFQRPVVRKTSATFMTWLRNLCGMGRKTRTLFF